MTHHIKELALPHLRIKVLKRLQFSTARRTRDSSGTRKLLPVSPRFG